MSVGKVIGQEACIGVIFLLPGNDTFEHKFIVDTGFEGALALPRETIDNLGLPYYVGQDCLLADDSSVQVDVYSARILWQGKEINVAVLAMGHRPLLGTSLLTNRHLGIDFVDGGPVTVHDLP